MFKYSGECYCGTVKFYCDGDPLFTQYCHCNKCRAVASQSKRDADKQGYAWTAGYLTSSFNIWLSLWLQESINFQKDGV